MGHIRSLQRVRIGRRGLIAIAACAPAVVTAQSAYAQAFNDTCNNTTECVSAGNSSTGYGIYVNQTGSGGAAAVYGVNVSSNGIALEGVGGSEGVNGQGTSYGVYGQSTNGYGVYGNSSSSYGVSGNSSTGFGVYGTTASASNAGVLGAAPAYGVQGTPTGSNTTQAGVFGYTTHHGFGVVGTFGAAQANASYTNSGVFGASDTADGVVGTTSASASGVAAGFFYTSAGSSSTAVAAENLSTGTGLYASSSGGNAGYFAGNVTVTGSCTGCGSGSSDIRMKKNVASITAALDELLKLRGVTFEWIDPDKHGNETGAQYGFVAQEVEKVFPNWVREGTDGFKVLNYRQTEALEVESIRSLKLENDNLKARVKALEVAARPVISMGGNGLGLTVVALAMAGSLITSRRRREHDAP